MILWWVVLAAVLSPVASLAQQMPFAPGPVPVDYMATRVVKSNLGGEKIVTQAIAHGSGWTRLLFSTVDQSRAVERQHYFNAAGRVLVLAALTENQGQFLMITRNPDDSLIPGAGFASAKTGEKDTSLGEHCEVWNVKEKHSSGAISCVTSDGIELWRRIPSGNWEARLTHLERRTVVPDEVLPPAGLLTLGPDMLPTSSSEGWFMMPDHEVVLHGKQPEHNVEPTIVTMRRRCPWTYEDVRGGDTRRAILIENLKSGVMITYARRDADGYERLLMQQDKSSTRKCGQLADYRWTGVARYEVILDKLCHWYNLSPNVVHSHETACLTFDSITLKSKLQTDRGGINYDREAISLRRGPVNAKDVTLPAELLSPSYWGLPR